MSALPNFEKTNGAGGSHGTDYEKYMFALIALRLYEKKEEFAIARDYADFHGFDDIVFFLRMQDRTWSGHFIQLKHKLNECTMTYDQLFRPKCESHDYSFDMIKYNTAYNNIKNKFNRKTPFELKGCKMSMEKYYMFTNATFRNGTIKKTMDIELLKTDERQINEMLDPSTNPIYSAFLSNVIFCSGAASLGKLKKIFAKELKQFWKKSFPNVNELHLCSDLVEELQNLKWVENESFETLLGKLYCHLPLQVKLTWKTEFLQALNARMPTEGTFHIKCDFKHNEIFKDMLSEWATINLTADKLDVKYPGIRKYFLSDEPKTCVVDLTKGDLQDLYMMFTKLPENQTTILLISEHTEDDILKSLLINCGSKQLDNFKCTFMDLTTESKQFLNAEDVTFQGKHMKMQSVMTIEEFQANNYDYVPIISNLMCGKLVIGKDLLDPKEFEKRPVYTERLISTKLFSRAPFEPIAISGIKNLKQFCIENNLSSDLCLSFERFIKTREIRKFIILSDNADEEYVQLVSITPAHRLHKSKYGLVWYKSFLPLDRLRSFLENTKLKIDIDEINDRLVVISGRPGTGKSFVLKYLARKAKHLDPTTWVSYVCSESLNAYKKGDTLPYIILGCAEGAFEADIFINKTNFKKVILFVDLDHTDWPPEEIARHLYALASQSEPFLRFQRVILSCGPNHQRLLEDIFHTISFDMEPNSFLTKLGQRVWRKGKKAIETISYIP